MIRDLLPEDINQLVSVSGMVTRCSNVIPEMQCAQPIAELLLWLILHGSLLSFIKYSSTARCLVALLSDS